MTNDDHSSELVPLEGVVTGSTMTRDDLHLRPRGELEMTARKWFEIAKDMKNIQDQLVEDLETALNLCRNYQGIMAMLEYTNDPNHVKVRTLLTKYGMDYTTPGPQAKVFCDGVDITEHPDSIPGATEVLELVADEEGNMHFLIKGEDE